MSLPLVLIIVNAVNAHHNNANALFLQFLNKNNEHVFDVVNLNNYIFL